MLHAARLTADVHESIPSEEAAESAADDNEPQGPMADYKADDQTNERLTVSRHVGNAVGQAHFAVGSKIAAALDSRPAVSAAPPATADRAGSNKLRILLAEDHGPTAKLMSMTLRKLGCEVTSVDNGVMAINAVKSMLQTDSPAQQNVFDIIFMDGNMPHLGKFHLSCTL